MSAKEKRPGASPVCVVESSPPAGLSGAQVARRFQGLLEAGARLLPVGEAKKSPRSLLRGGYTPRHCVELFGAAYYLTNVRQNPDIRFFVGYVVLRNPRGRRIEIHPRIFYKDVSLVWRSASHFIRSEDENWIGKGDVRCHVVDGEELWHSAEETTDLPLEIQTALETLSREARSVPTDHRAVPLVLRRGPSDRIEPYRDFSEPRRLAARDPRQRIHGGRSIARFTRQGDPTSLVFASGFAPDFGRGVIEASRSDSRLYGGTVRRFRILSSNRIVQYLFLASPLHVWIAPPQATTTAITSYGVRAVDVVHDEDLCVPGYEYHFIDEFEDPPKLFSQIPAGFVGEPSAIDASRSDASPWIERLPVVRKFRRAVLDRGGRVNYSEPLDNLRRNAGQRR